MGDVLIQHVLYTRAPHKRQWTADRLRTSPCSIWPKQKSLAQWSRVTSAPAYFGQCSARRATCGRSVRPHCWLACPIGTQDNWPLSCFASGAIVAVLVVSCSTLNRETIKQAREYHVGILRTSDMSILRVLLTRATHTANCYRLQGVR